MFLTHKHFHDWMDPHSQAFDQQSGKIPLQINSSPSHMFSRAQTPRTEITFFSLVSNAALCSVVRWKWNQQMGGTRSKASLTPQRRGIMKVEKSSDGMGVQMKESLQWRSGGEGQCFFFITSQGGTLRCVDYRFSSLAKKHSTQKIPHCQPGSADILTFSVCVWVCVGRKFFFLYKGNFLGQLIGILKLLHNFSLYFKAPEKWIWKLFSSLCLAHVVIQVETKKLLFH